MRRLVLFALLVALVVFTALVATGALAPLDRYAVAHWMPWLNPRHHRLLDVRALLVPAGRGSVAARALDVWTYPASVLASAVVVGACAWLRRRADLAVLWVAGNVLELAGKLALHKPALYHHGRHVVAFDHSYPSGHTIRGALVAYAVAVAWRRAAPYAAGWFATVPFALVALGYHTPTDVIGGVVVAAILVVLSIRPVRVLRSSHPKWR